MTKIPLLSLSTLLLTLFLTYPSLQTLPLQAHSFNDLDYLVNILNKGINYYKLDVSMANRQSCSAHSTWKPTSKCFSTNQYVQQICCLGMRGDASSRPDFKYDFNTTDDFLVMLEGVMSSVPASRTLLFAINFQYQFSFDDYLTEAFLSKLVGIMEKYPKNLLMGTGSDSFILQYDRICSQHDPLCTSERKKISQSQIFLQSSSYNPSDKRDVYHRYRNFNTMFKSIDQYCKNGFPTWINQYPEFPLIFWEPSDESQIQYVLNKFMDPACMKKHNRTLDGMAMATNIDTEMFEIYLKKTVNILDKPYREWSTESEKGLLPGVIDTQITSTKINMQWTIFGAGKNVTSNCVVIFMMTYSALNKSLKFNIAKQIKSQCGDSQVQNIQTTSQSVLITLNSPSSSSIYSYDLSLNLIRARTMSNSFIYASTYFSNSNQLILVYSYPSLTDQRQYLIEGTSNFQDYHPYSQLKSSLKISSIAEYNDMFLVLGEESDGKSGTISKAMVVDKKSGSILNSGVILSRGSNPKIMVNGDTLSILLQNSMCHSAILINNSDMNKCSFYKETQFQDISNVKGLVNLLQGSYQSIITQNPSNEIVGPCHKKISFSKIMNGATPDFTNLLDQMFLSSNYLRVEDQDFIGAVFCGGSNYSIENKQTKGTIFTTKKDMGKQSYKSQIKREEMI